MSQCLRIALTLECRYRGSFYRLIWHVDWHGIAMAIGGWKIKPASKQIEVRCYYVTNPSHYWKGDRQALCAGTACKDVAESHPDSCERFPLLTSSWLIHFEQAFGTFFLSISGIPGTAWSSLRHEEQLGYWQQASGKLWLVSGW